MAMVVGGYIGFDVSWREIFKKARNAPRAALLAVLALLFVPLKSGSA